MTKPRIRAFIGKGKKKYIALFVVLCFAIALLIISITLFSLSFSKVNKAIDSERVSYVDEITYQMINNYLNTRKEFKLLTEMYVRCLETEKFSSLKSISEHIHFSKDVFPLLIKQNGDVIDLNNNIAKMDNQRLLQAFLLSENQYLKFIEINNTDYLVYVDKLHNVEINNETFIGLITAIPISVIRKRVVVSLFDNNGAAYIIEKNGTICFQPEENRNIIKGFNFYSILRAKDAPEKEINSFISDIINETDGNREFLIDGMRWFVNYCPINSKNTVIACIPVSITAKSTNKQITITILYSMLFVFSIVLIIASFLLFYNDMSIELKKESFAAKAKSDFFSKMSHDIRTPLNAIMGLLSLAKNTSDEEKKNDYLIKSSSSAEYLLSIINDVLDMDRIESGKLKITNNPFSINKFISDVSDVVNNMIANKNIRYESSMDFIMPTSYLGDTVRLKQILINLLNNAVKFTPDGGEIKLIITHEKKDQNKDIVTFIVSDTGIGISSSFLPLLFKPFEQEASSFTRQTEGSGLGLSIVYNLVSLMNGKIIVNSEEGKGSSFCVSIPFETCPNNDVNSAVEEYKKYKDVRILMAEDNDLNQLVAVTLLNDVFNITCDVANNGVEAIEIFNKSAIHYYDLIIMDIKMPVLGGLESAKRIRDLERIDAKTIPIVALSANAFEADVDLSIKAGMNRHLSKPLSIPELANILNEFLKDKQV